MDDKAADNPVALSDVKIIALRNVLVQVSDLAYLVDDIEALCAMAARYEWLRRNLLSFCIQSGRYSSGRTNHMHVPDSAYVDRVIDRELPVCLSDKEGR